MVVNIFFSCLIGHSNSYFNGNNGMTLIVLSWEINNVIENLSTRNHLIFYNRLYVFCANAIFRRVLLL